ncbi:MAG TPA: MFS transporter [Thermoanaerobaculia bacterium]|nr:MFS transporter [Thermoanaerobaculia bacterium]
MSPPPEAAGATPATHRPGTLESLWRALSSWRTASVVLLSFSSGMPLGLVWIAIPDWMRDAGVDIRIVGLFSLAQAPWTFNVLWAPVLDRYRPPFLGRRRGWIVIAQLLLVLGILALSGVGDRPEAPWVALAITLAIGFAAASQDIVIDAYAVDVLRKEEQGVAVGARIALYRAGMWLAGAIAITLAAQLSWAVVCAILAALFVPMIAIAVFAPEPAREFEAPSTLREAVWHPFLGFLSRHRALEILAFVLLFKLCDNFAQALLRPFLNDMGYSAVDRGVALGTIGLFSQIGGALLGGICTNLMGLGPALWSFGTLQIFSNLGYVLLANIDPHRGAMYGAMGFENLTQGLGTGAFSVLLLRMTQKRFSAAQYALFSTLFGLGRIVSGPIAGFTVDAVGWSTFFWITLPLGLPGLVMLQRFVPLGTREPSFELREVEAGPPLTRSQLGVRGSVAGVVATLGGAGLMALLAALKASRAEAGGGFPFGASLAALLQPGDLGGWLQLVGLIAFGATCGLLAAAVAAARRGAGRELARTAG